MLQQWEVPCSNPSKTKGLSLCPGTDPQSELPPSEHLSRVSEPFSFVFGSTKGPNSIRCMIHLISNCQLEPIPSKSTSYTHIAPVITVPGEGGPMQEDTSLSCRGWIHAGCDRQLSTGNNHLSCCQQVLSLCPGKQSLLLGRQVKEQFRNHRMGLLQLKGKSSAFGEKKKKKSKHSWGEGALFTRV